MLHVIEKLYAWLHDRERYARIGWGGQLAAGIAFIAFVMGGHHMVPQIKPKPSTPGAVQQCYFHVITGLPCPLCGLTRGCREFLLGHWSRSMDLHPASSLLCLAALLWIMEASRRVLAKHPARPADAGTVGLLGSLFAFAIGLVATWIQRLSG